MRTANSEQVSFLPSTESLARGNAEAILSSFLRWFDALPITEGDRKPVEWFALEVRDYFADPMREPWGCA